MLYYLLGHKKLHKAIILVDNMDNMLQRQIVNGLGKQIEDALYIKYTIRCFHYIDCMFIPVHVTIDRTVPIQAYQSSNYCMMMNMTKLRSCV
jgi:hypothetical protein